jgi:hypothetical protein
MDNNNNNTNTNYTYEKLFILSKTYCYYCHCCNYCRETTHMKHTFNYDDINNNINNNDIWNKMIELTMNTNNNNFKNNEINIGTYIYYSQSENSSCEFNLPIHEQRRYLIREFTKKYLELNEL